MTVMKNTMSKVLLYFLMAKALVALLHPAWLLAVDLDLQHVGSYRVEDIPKGSWWHSASMLSRSDF